MSAKENIALVTRYIKEINAVKADATKLNALFDKYSDPKFVWHLTMGDFNLEQAKQISTSIYESLPDMYNTIDDIMAAGDKVIVRATMRATHKGEYLGVKPTGKKIQQIGIMIARIAKGKMVELWMVNDTFGLMIQLGAIPNPFVRR
jgi:predicted ester cyclase